MRLVKMRINLFTTLNQAFDFIHQHMRAGCQCPACGQVVKLYKHKLTRQHVDFMVWLYRQPGQQGHYRDFVRAFPKWITTQHGIPKHWGLIEEVERHSGVWKLTYKGARFLSGGIKVAKYAYIFNNDLVDFDDPWVGVEDAYGERFDLDEIMNYDDE